VTRQAVAPLRWLLLAATLIPAVRAQEASTLVDAPSPAVAEPARPSALPRAPCNPTWSLCLERPYSLLLSVGPVLSIDTFGLEVDAGIRISSLLLRYTGRITGQLDQPYLVYQGGRLAWLTGQEGSLGAFLGMGAGAITWHFSDRPMLHTWAANLELGVTGLTAGRMMPGFIGVEFLVPGKSGGPDPVIILIVVSVNPFAFQARGPRRD
jgi:hypothetical protein